MALTTSATTVVTKQVALKPSLKRRLLNELKALNALRDQIKVLEHAQRQHRTEIEDCLAESGEASLALDGYKVTLVQPVVAKLDKMKLVALGVTTAQIEEATTHSPGKPYVKISAPGDKGHDAHD